ncbi:hypothetical protein BH10PSE17_BH10PSE17_17680 [soil metagenome]
MMSPKPAAPIAVENVNVKIMGRDYSFACAPEERASLLECVGIVDRKMMAIKSAGKLSAVDRIAVMAALTIANESASARHAVPTDSNKRGAGLDFASLEPTIDSLNAAMAEFLDQVAPQLSLDTDVDSLALPFSPRSNTP